MHLLAIFLQYLLGRLLNKPQPQPVPIPVRQPNYQAPPDRQAFDSTSDPPGRTSIFYGSTESGTSVPGLNRSGHNTAFLAVAVLSAMSFGVDRPGSSSTLSALSAFAAAVGGFSPAMRA